MEIEVTEYCFLFREAERSDGSVYSWISMVLRFVQADAVVTSNSVYRMLCIYPEGTFLMLYSYGSFIYNHLSTYSVGVYFVNIFHEGVGSMPGTEHGTVCDPVLGPVASDGHGWVLGYLGRYNNRSRPCHLQTLKMYPRRPLCRCAVSRLMVQRRVRPPLLVSRSQNLSGSVSLPRQLWGGGGADRGGSFPCWWSGSCQSQQGARQCKTKLALSCHGTVHGAWCNASGSSTCPYVVTRGRMFEGGVYALGWFGVLPNGGGEVAAIGKYHDYF